MNRDDIKGYIERQFKTPVEELLSFPKYIQIETVRGCNSRCYMCGAKFGKSVALMDQGTLDKLLNEIERNIDSIQRVSLQKDGEPLLDKRMPPLITRLKEIGVKEVVMTTNGGLLTDQITQELIRSGLDQLHISFDSLDPRVYQEIRKGLHFDTTLANIKNFCQQRDQLGSRTVVRIQKIIHPKYPEDLERFKRFFIEEVLGNEDVVSIKDLHSFGNSIDQDSGCQYDPNLYPCKVLWSSFVVLYNGNVARCCVDTNDEGHIGNIEKNTIEEIWRGRSFDEIRKTHSSGQRHAMEACNGCNVWDPNNGQVQKK